MKAFGLFVVVACVLLCSGGVERAFAAIAGDQVTSLPGWNKALPSKHYSGLIPINNGKAYIHYWFIESEKNPTTDPVVVWLNGGPGSSSLVGLLTENGQFITNNDSVDKDGNINLIYNPYSWSQAANMLYVEQPKGVGFSYCEPGEACVNDDSTVGPEFADFLETWFNGFSEYKQNDFYITGESYAGIYIPEIMVAIDAKGNINMKGAAIGDGCIGNNVSTCGTPLQSNRISAEFYYGNAMYPQPLYKKIKAACGNFTHSTAECTALLLEMNLAIGNFDIYNVYDQCGNDQVTHTELIEQLHKASSFEVKGGQAFHSHPQLHEGVAGALKDYVCGAENIMGQWLDQPDVKKALHVSKQGNQIYHRTVDNLLPTYKSLAQKYRMLIYSGSVDGCVPYWGSEEWTRNLGFPQKEAWRAWLSASNQNPKETDILAGYVTTYDAGAHDFTFLTVSGAGHLVPQHKPAQALTMFTRFLNNQPF